MKLRVFKASPEHLLAVKIQVHLGGQSIKFRPPQKSRGGISVMSVSLCHCTCLGRRVPSAGRRQTTRPRLLLLSSSAHAPSPCSAAPVSFPTPLPAFLICYFLQPSALFSLSPCVPSWRKLLKRRLSGGHILGAVVSLIPSSV